ncbi:glycosyltransferase [Pseudodesulfovibrio methanolicus]|uniref:Glycosyltransferase n=1 Tax=Pseudodesulfovibrio methanolicus TaxID=3126690 RepID=A0ABZ2IYL3_9BACT
MGLPEISVVFVLQDLEFGGTQRQTLELLRRLDRSQFTPELWILRDGGDFLQNVRTLGIPSHVLSSCLAVNPTSLLNLWRRLRRTRPDILIPMTVVPNIWCRLLGRLAGCPVILGTCRGGGSVKRQHEKRLWRLAHHHACNAEALCKGLAALGTPSHRLTLIENGIDVAQWDAGPRSDIGKRLLAVGRLHEDKDHETLLHAMALLPEHHADARLTIVGDGPLQHELQTTAGRLGLDDRVRFEPARHDLLPYYAQSTLLVHPSRREALPNSIMEGAAAGLPVIATDVGGVSRLVVEGKTGLLVEPGDAKELAQAICTLLDAPERAHDMGSQGKQHMQQHFSMDAMVQNYETLLHDLAAVLRS